jgi:hypothetical protein
MAQVHVPLRTSNNGAHYDGGHNREHHKPLYLFFMLNHSARRTNNNIHQPLQLQSKHHHIVGYTNCKCLPISSEWNSLRRRAPHKTILCSDEKAISRCSKPVELANQPRTTDNRESSTKWRTCLASSLVGTSIKHLGRLGYEYTSQHTVERHETHKPEYITKISKARQTTLQWPYQSGVAQLLLHEHALD